MSRWPSGRPGSPSPAAHLAGEKGRFLQRPSQLRIAVPRRRGPPSSTGQRSARLSRRACRVDEGLGFTIERLRASRVAEVIRLACVLRLRGCRFWFHRHPANRIDFLAYAGPPCLVVVDPPRVTGSEAIGIGDESVPAAVRAKEVGL